MVPDGLQLPQRRVLCPAVIRVLLFEQEWVLPIKISEILLPIFVLLFGLILVLFFLLGFLVFPLLHFLLCSQQESTLSLLGLLGFSVEEGESGRVSLDHVEDENHTKNRSVRRSKERETCELLYESTSKVGAQVRRIKKHVEKFKKLFPVLSVEQ